MPVLATALALWCLQVPEAGAPPVPTRLVAALFVNQQTKGDVFAVLSNGDVWLPVAALSAAGLVEVGGERRDWYGAPHVSLRSLAPALSYALDMVALTLRVTASAALFPRTSITLQAARPPAVEYLRSPGLFVNYGVTVQQGAKPAAAVETGLSLAGALLSSSFTRVGDHRVLRGLTSLTIDERSRMRRIIIGDTSGRASLLGSAPLVVGISIRSQFSLDPYQVAFPLPSVQGAVATPATAEVYVNDRLVSRQKLPPGAFQLLRLPAQTGLGNVRVVVRDLLGREQEFGGATYVSSNVLRPGVSEYTYLLGFARTDTFGRGPSYGVLTGSASHRVGVTRWLTLGAHAEGAPQVAAVGSLVNVRLWRVGEISAAASLSHSGGLSGTAVSGSYVVLARPFSATVSASHVGAHYSSLSLGARDPRPRDRLDASVGVTLGHLASVLVARSYVAGAPDTALAPSFVSQARLRDSATLTLRLGSRTRLAVSVARTALAKQVRPTFQGYASMNVVLPGRRVSTITHARTGDVGSTSIDLQRSLPLGDGLGYRLQADTANAGSANAFVQMQNRHGRLGVRQTSLNGQWNTSLDVSGGLVLIGGELHPSRRIDDGYALVRVSAGPGIRVYLNDQVVGRTNGGGSVLVPNLLSNLGNPIRIADEDAPLDYELSRVRALVAPPWRGAAVVTFAAVRLQAVTGRVLLVRGGEDVVPAFGRLVVVADGTENASPVGAEGEFFLHRVPPGDHPGRLTFEGRTCAFTVPVPTGTTFITDIGPIRCHAIGDAR